MKNIFILIALVLAGWQVTKAVPQKAEPKTCEIVAVTTLECNVTLANYSIDAPAIEYCMIACEVEGQLGLVRQLDALPGIRPEVNKVYHNYSYRSLNRSLRRQCMKGFNIKQFHRKT